MTLVKYKDNFKDNFEDFELIENISVGKIDQSKEKMVTFYNAQPEMNIGFKNAVNTNTKNVKVLLRYGTNQRKAEEMAWKIQKFYDKKSFKIDERQIFAMLTYSEPISVGTDEKNIYEYVFNIKFIEN